MALPCRALCESSAPAGFPAGDQHTVGRGGGHLLGRHGAQVLAIHPRQLGLVKDGRALCDAVQRKLLLQVLQRVDLLR